MDDLDGDTHAVIIAVAVFVKDLVFVTERETVGHLEFVCVEQVVGDKDILLDFELLEVDVGSIVKLLVKDDEEVELADLLSDEVALAGLVALVDILRVIDVVSVFIDVSVVVIVLTEVNVFNCDIVNIVDLDTNCVLDGILLGVSLDVL